MLGVTAPSSICRRAASNADSSSSRRWPESLLAATTWAVCSGDSMPRSTFKA
jgi:hypothetical protein